MKSNEIDGKISFDSLCNIFMIRRFNQITPSLLFQRIFRILYFPVFKIILIDVWQNLSINSHFFFFLSYVSGHFPIVKFQHHSLFIKTSHSFFSLETLYLLFIYLFIGGQIYWTLRPPLQYFPRERGSKTSTDAWKCRE